MCRFGQIIMEVKRLGGKIPNVDRQLTFEKCRKKIERRMIRAARKVQIANSRDLPFQQSEGSSSIQLLGAHCNRDSFVCD